MSWCFQVLSNTGNRYKMAAVETTIHFCPQSHTKWRPAELQFFFFFSNSHLMMIWWLFKFWFGVESVALESVQHDSGPNFRLALLIGRSLIDNWAGASLDQLESHETRNERENEPWFDGGFAWLIPPAPLSTCERNDVCFYHVSFFPPLGGGGPYFPIKIPSQSPCDDYRRCSYDVIMISFSFYNVPFIFNWLLDWITSTCTSWLQTPWLRNWRLGLTLLMTRLRLLAIGNGSKGDRFDRWSM